MFSDTINGAPALDWVAVAELAGYPDVLHLQRTTAFGHYDDGFVLACNTLFRFDGQASNAMLHYQLVSFLPPP
jgi:sarcosine oxidase subunit alpha